MLILFYEEKITLLGMVCEILIKFLVLQQAVNFSFSYVQFKQIFNISHQKYKKNLYEIIQKIKPPLNNEKSTFNNVTFNQLTIKQNFGEEFHLPQKCTWCWDIYVILCS